MADPVTPTPAATETPASGATTPVSIPAATEVPAAESAPAVAAAAPAPVATPVAAEAPAVAPAVAADVSRETPVPAEPAPSVTAPPSEASAEPVAPAEPPAEAAPEKPEITPHTETPSLLETALDKPEEKPAEGEKVEKVEEPSTESRPSYAFTLPEGMTADPEQMKPFTDWLGDHRIAADKAQALLDMHTSALQSYADHLAAEQHRAFAKTREDWRNEVLADDALGGSGHQTAMAAIGRVRDIAVPEADRDAFNDFLRVTGAGDHPAFLRALHRLSRYFDEPQSAPQSGRPPPDAGRPTRATRRGIIYDHPSSRHGA